jgi:hypothetical protein
MHMESLCEELNSTMEYGPVLKLEILAMSLFFVGSSQYRTSRIGKNRRFFSREYPSPSEKRP